MTTENLWDAEKADLRLKFLAILLPQETRKTSNRNVTLHLKQLEKKNNNKKKK